MSEYLIHCERCGFEGKGNSKWVPLNKLPEQSRHCPQCGQAVELEAWCTLPAEASVLDH